MFTLKGSFGYVEVKKYRESYYYQKISAYVNRALMSTKLYSSECFGLFNH